MSSGPYLYNARNEYGTFEDAADAVIDQLNAELEVIRVDELEALVSELSDMTKKNAVKEWITNVLAQAVINSPRSEAEKRLDLQRIEKLQKRLNLCMKRPMYAKQMTDNEIREKFVEAKEWKKGFAQMIV